MDPRGPVAQAMADLWWLMLWLGVAVFIVFMVLLAVGLFRKPSLDDDQGSRANRWIIIWGIAAPFVVIVVVFVATISAMRAVPTDAPDNALIVDITGRQWTYEIAYPGTGVTVRDELHIPVGRSVALRLTSADVIHSFWVPELAGKLDMLPDGVNTLVLQADEPGEYISRCAEFCGLDHTTMRLIVVAEPAEQFEQWLQQQVVAAENRSVSRVDGAGPAKHSSAAASFHE